MVKTWHLAYLDSPRQNSRRPVHILHNENSQVLRTMVPGYHMIVFSSSVPVHKWKSMRSKVTKNYTFRELEYEVKRGKNYEKEVKEIFAMN